ncbi:MAG: hypothetical protein KAQ98_06945 [Bacteriovoracaceae bacterium]|nr:hypothetical protein [Bacteriovoracaceae bacterium]
MRSKENIHQLIKKYLFEKKEEKKSLSSNIRPWNMQPWDMMKSSVQDELHRINPHTNHYHSKLRTVFLLSMKDVDLLNSVSFVLIRDGSFSLMNFFRLHPVPGTIKTTFIINRDLAYFVPKEWKKQVAIYSTHLNFHSNEVCNNPDEIILTGVMDKFQASERYLEEILNEIKAKYGKKLEHMSIKCLSCYNPNYKDHDGYFFKYVAKLVKILGTKIEYINWKDIEDRNFKRTVFLDLNESKVLYSGSFIVHGLLSRGALPFRYDGNSKTNQDTPDKVTIVSESVYHKYRITDSFPEDYHSIRNEIESKIAVFNKLKFTKESNTAKKTDVHFNSIHSNLKSFASDLGLFVAQNKTL